jgi:hypothetical protein
MLSAADLAKKAGRFVLFVGTEAYTWTMADYVTAAKNARAFGFDTISPKVADGGIKWYHNAAHLQAIRNAVLSQGCGFLPFQYLYGPKFGDEQIKLEANVAKEIASVCDNMVCLDLEAEWNGADAAAQELANQFAGSNIDIILSTWADPIQQNWLGVVRALDPIVAAWGPQEYTSWLATQETQFTNLGINTNKLFPALDVVDVFAGSNPLDAIHNVLSKAHPSIWVWEYQSLFANATVLKTLISLLPKAPTVTSPATPKPSTVPVPKAGSSPVTKSPAMQTPAAPITHTTNSLGWANYTIHDGDSLSTVASRLGVTNWQADLYIPNRTTLDAVARGMGQANSQGGNLVYPGTVIKYPVLK